MPYGMGDLLASLGGGAQNNQDIASAITPNPNPLAQQGGAPDGSSQQAQQGFARPAVTQQDPTVGNLAAALMRKSEMARAAEGFNRGTAEMASAFGTAQQQASKKAALGAGGGGANPLGDVQDIMGIQKDVTTQNEHARFMANMDVLARTLFPNDPDGLAKATEVANNSGLLSQFGQAASGNATATTTMKDADAAAREYATAHPEAGPKDIADFKSNLIAGGMGGNDLETRQYLDEKRNGITTDDFATWKGKKAAEAAGAVTETKNVKEFRDNATADYTPLNSKLTSVQTALDILNKDPDAAQAALQSFSPTTGKWAAINPLVSQKVKDAAAALQKVQSSLSADQLAGTKNVRNQREFATLGQAANAGLNAAASPDDFRKGLEDITNKFLDAQATLELTVGHRLAGKLVGHGNQDLLDKKNPYFQGGSQDNDFKEMSESDAEAAINKLPSGARFVGPDGQVYTKK